MGDLSALKAALGDSPGFPNDPLPLDVFGPAGTVLELAIYRSPLSLIRQLLEIGADPNPPAHMHAGFPPLHAALTSLTPAAGSQTRADVPDLLRLLLSHGADPNQRGHNDWTPLHVAAHASSVEAIRILLEGGADPTLRTRIDDCLTPREESEQAGRRDIAALLAAAEDVRR